ncbi:MAG: DUF523 domain-containing protein [Proteobacteria bacterium]|nr:DUF523 domain-containing protein [Pseudomonadota bacterium]MBU1639484.1 DUF523 domain-containing protein [Pseudomonadota bacterium]
MDCDEKKKPRFLVSSCLVGLASRYDGCSKENAECLQFLGDKVWLPVCPEQLGGLATPRPAAVLVGGDGAAVLSGAAHVVTRDGIDVSTQFIKGAEQVLSIARQQGICGICLKARSPSCAVSGQQGVTAALLVRHGFSLYEF